MKFNNTKKPNSEDEKIILMIGKSIIDSFFNSDKTMLHNNIDKSADLLMRLLSLLETGAKIDYKKFNIVFTRFNCELSKIIDEEEQKNANNDNE